MPSFRSAAFSAALASPVLGSSHPGAVALGGEAPPRYDESVALMYASLAVAAFCGSPHFPDGRLIDSWQCGPACEAVPSMREVRYIETANYDNAYAFVGRYGTGSNAECVVSFRGTDNFAGWLSDLESGRSVTLDSYGIPCEWSGYHCRVGYGFINNYMHMREYLLGNLTDLGCPGLKVSVTGHSLGAAIAVVALYDLRTTQGYAVSDSYTFGQPRVGNFAFVNALNTSLAGEAGVFRITHHKDPVPHLPFEIMGFRHHAREIYYDGATTDGFVECDGSGEDRVCSNQWGGFAALLTKCLIDAKFGQCEHMTYMTPLLPYIMGPASCSDSGNLFSGGVQSIV